MIHESDSKRPTISYKLTLVTENTKHYHCLPEIDLNPFDPVVG